MGGFPESIFLHLGMKEMKDKESNSNGSLWIKTMEAEAKARRRNSFKNRRSPRSRFLMRRRSAGSRRRRPANGIERRLNTLWNLIPNTNVTESVGLEQIFTETADYILSLQRRVRLMQTLVNVLSGYSDE